MRDAMGMRMACGCFHAFMGTNSWASILLNLERNSRPFPCVPAAACPRLSAPRARLARRPSLTCGSACAPGPARPGPCATPDPDGGARHRASGASVDAAVFSTAVPLSSPTRRVRVRRSRLPRTDARLGCACGVRARARRRRPPAADPGADCPAALEASELRATRYIRGLRTKIIWGTMDVRHGAHTDTRAKSEQRPTHLLSCFEIG